MPSSEEINAIFDRILAGQATEADIHALRLELQQGKYRIEAEQLNANEIHIGDRIYHGADAEAIRAVLRSVLDEQQKLLEQQRAKRPRLERDFLGMVKAEVADCLKQSLHHAVLINLGKEEQPEQVERLWDAKIKVAGHPNAVLPSDTKIIEVFSREDIAGRLLILGNPGSGKTTTLLELAKALTDRAETDPDFPMPVLFNLSSWKENNQPLHEWMVQELKLRGVRSDITHKWLDKHKLLPMLDGLDEMESDRQETCVEAINKQILTGEKSLPYLVVCSRNQEYDNYETKLLLNGAFFIQELTIDKIQSYLNSVGQFELCHVLDHDTDLLALVRTPLFLGIASLAFQELSRERWQVLTTTESRIEYLLEAYVQKMMERKLERSALKNLYGKHQPPSDRKTRIWLIGLALQMQAQSQIEFLIERIPNLIADTFWIKLDWLALLLFICAFIIRLFGSRLWGVAFLGACAIYLLKILVDTRNIELSESFYFSWKQAKETFIGTSTILQPTAIFLGIGFELSNQDAIFFKVLFFILAWSISSVENRSRNIITIIAKISTGLSVILLVTNIHSSLQKVFLHIFISSLGFGIPIALMFGFISGLKRTELRVKRSPNQGVWKSAKNAVLVLLVVELMSILIGSVLGLILTVKSENLVVNLLGGAIAGLILGLFPGFLMALTYGGEACIKHGILRFYLYSRGWIPWNYAQFLNYCTERSLLQRVGGRYQFIHRLLQEHFAAMSFKSTEGNQQRPMSWNINPLTATRRSHSNSGKRLNKINGDQS